MKKITIYILLLVALIPSCTEDDNKPTYSVDTTLDGYLQRFLQEGEKRGHTFDLQESGLIMKFGDLDGDAAGRCYYEDPIRIVFDTEYWNNIANSQNVDDLYEDLVFHELGHGLLKRGHINDYLSNGDWKTIMCGGEEKDNRSWNINYQGIRKEYYIDELFNPSTSEPSWASQTSSTSLNTDTIIVQDEFNSIISSWPYGVKQTYTASYNNGAYTFYNNLDDGTLVIKRIDLNTSSDFYIEAKIKLTAQSSDDQFGLVFGTVSSPVYVNYYTINNNARMFMGNTACYGWFTELLQSGLVPNEYNILGLRKIGQDLYYFINGECIYYEQLTETQSGYDYGFELAGKATLEVDYFYMYTNKSSFKSTRIIDAGIQEPLPITLPKGTFAKK